MENLIRFVKQNKAPLAGMAVGLICGYLYWYYIACYWGTLPMSSECWVNCAFGALTGGFLACLFKEHSTVQKS